MKKEHDAYAALSLHMPQAMRSLRNEGWQDLSALLKKTRVWSKKFRSVSVCLAAAAIECNAIRGFVPLERTEFWRAFVVTKDGSWHENYDDAAYQMLRHRIMQTASRI